MLPEAVLEVMDPCFGSRLVRAAKFPFTIGRGPENDLLLLDTRISRQCAAILYVDDTFHVEDRGNQLGVHLNGKQIHCCLLQDGSTISFGSADSYTLVFHAGPTRGLKDASVVEAPVHALRQVSLLLEAVALARSELPMEDILALLVDRAIDVSGAARGALLQAQGDGRLQPVVARQRGARPLAPDTLRSTWWVEASIKRAIEEHKSIFEFSTGDGALQVGYAEAGLLTWHCVPLWTQRQMPAGDPTQERRREQLLGLLYLDNNSKDASAFVAGLSFQLENILNALAMQAASLLTNARLVQIEEERRRMEQELAIARKIQQALLPKSFKHPAHLQVSGFNQMCLSVGGDYFDLMDLGADCTAFAIADVAGKGLGAALVTSMLQGAFSAMMLGAELIELFDHTNRMVFERTEDSRFSTLFFGTLLADGTLHYINAGHPPPLLVRSGNVQEAFKAESVPLGLFPNAEFTSRVHRLEPGDTLVLYTDGITEAMDAEGNQFGSERLQETVMLNSGASVEGLQASILKALDEFAHGGLQTDDITILILRYLGAPMAPCRRDSIT